MLKSNPLGRSKITFAQRGGGVSAHRNGGQTSSDVHKKKKASLLRIMKTFNPFSVD